MIYKNVMRCHIIKVMAKMLISSSWYYLLLQYSLVLDTLEKELVTHSSILAWEIPWTEEPCWL